MDYIKKNWLFLLFSIIVFDYLVLKDRDLKHYKMPDYLSSWGFGAITLPPIGIFYNNQFIESTYNHELIHQNQYRRKGFFLYYFDYLVNSLLYGYRNNPLEQEAYQDGKH